MTPKPKPRRPANIIEAVTSPDWWGPWFPNPETWAGWRSFWKTIFALPIDDEDLEIFKECTGRSTPPATPAKEVTEIVGRRGGKTRGAATTTAWLAVFVDWRPFLAPGEKAPLCCWHLTDGKQKSRFAIFGRSSSITPNWESWW